MQRDQSGIADGFRKLKERQLLVSVATTGRSAIQIATHMVLAVQFSVSPGRQAKQHVVARFRQ